MELIDQSVEVWGRCPSDYTASMKWIERAARTCYASEPKPESAEAFIAKIMAPTPPHSSVMEHSNIAVDFGKYAYTKLSLLSKYKSKWLNLDINEGMVIHGNLRAWMECIGTKNPFAVYQQLESEGLILPHESLPREKQRVTVKLITDRAVLAEITRHRDDTGFSVQSQRYVDYRDDIQFIKPSWYDTVGFPSRETFHHGCVASEANYKAHRRGGLPPQHARVELTNQCATEIVMTAYMPQWDFIFSLRRGKGAYPQMILLMDMVYEKFQREGLV